MKDMKGREDIEDMEVLLEGGFLRSKKMPHLSMRDRAAQFAPFAALNGYEEVLKKAQSVSEKLHERDQEADCSDCQYPFHCC